MTQSPHLPGIRFEVQTPVPDQTLPRMDIALLVGFAARGPLHVPVAIEDTQQYGAVFGGDMELAWDETKHRFIQTQLGPAVRAFFANGGRRCWVVRAADEGSAETNRFAVPGLMLADGSAFTLGATSAGSWSDGWKVGAALQVQTLSLQGLLDFQSPPEGSVEALLNNHPGEVLVGDLLRLTQPDGKGVLLLVEAVVPELHTSEPLLRVRCTPQGQFQHQLPMHLDSTAKLWSHPHPLELPCRSLRTEHGGYILELNLKSDHTHAQQFKIGRLLTLSGSEGSPPHAGVLALTLEDLQVSAEGWLEVRGRGLYWSADSSFNMDSTGRLERLRLELWVRSGNEHPLRLGNLGFDPRHPRYVGHLPSDAQLYRSADLFEPLDQTRQAVQALWAQAKALHFPLAGKPSGLILPVGLETTPQAYVEAQHSERSSLERSGLGQFGPDLFLDTRLKDTGFLNLISEAEALRSTPDTLPLKGTHTALPIEEVTLIALPDAAHRNWRKAEIEPNQSTSIPAPKPEPQPCQQLVFEDCKQVVLHAPVLAYQDASPLDQSFNLVWSAGQLESIHHGHSTFTSATTHILQTAVTADFAKPFEQTLNSTSHAISNPAPGSHFYRMKAVWGDVQSNWSNGVKVEVARPKGWVLEETKQYKSAGLLDVQRALLRLCTARGDVLAVLGLPHHYRHEEALVHVRRLQAVPGGGLEGEFQPQTLSYGALFHPWLVGEDGLALTPEGTISGLLARHAIERGAWIAPANQRLRGVINLEPALLETSWLELQQAQINQIRQEPRGFLNLSAQTLSLDPDLKPIGVRRLLMLLRRLALREGNPYVFEPLNQSFARAVERAFGAFMRQLFLRGAFAGSTPEQSYQVVLGPEVNPQRSLDLGRFVVELRVAPSLPLRFITVRLIQTGDQGLVVEEGQSQ